jgi:hypothetical protein
MFERPSTRCDNWAECADGSRKLTLPIASHSRPLAQVNAANLKLSNAMHSV